MPEHRLQRTRAAYQGDTEVARIVAADKASRNVPDEVASTSISEYERNRKADEEACQSFNQFIVDPNLLPSRHALREWRDGVPRENKQS